MHCKVQSDKFHAQIHRVGLPYAYKYSRPHNAIAAVSAGNYTVPTTSRSIHKLYVGNVHLRSGGRIHLRSFGIVNITLWDDVIREFGEITENDIILFNFGAW
jgi:hypothetical protein